MQVAARQSGSWRPRPPTSLSGPVSYTEELGCSQLVHPHQPGALVAASQPWHLTTS